MSTRIPFSSVGDHNHKPQQQQQLSDKPKHNATNSNSEPQQSLSKGELEKIKGSLEESLDAMDKAQLVQLVKQYRVVLKHCFEENDMIRERISTIEAQFSALMITTERESPILIKVNADIQTKQRVFTHWCSFFVLVAIFVLCTVAIPDSTQSVGNKFCDQNYILPEGYPGFCQQHIPESFYLYVNKLSNSNQFLIVYGQFDLDLPEYVVDFLVDITYYVTVLEISEHDNKINVKSIIQDNIERTYTVDCKHNDNEGDKSDESDRNDDRLLQRYPPNNIGIPGVKFNNHCSKFVVMYEPVLNYKNYLIIVTPFAPTNFGMWAETVTTAYTTSILVIRYVFLCISLISGLLFYFRLKQLERKNWVIEQLLLVALSAELPFFNDPLYAATLLHPNLATAIIGIMFFTNFVCVLLLFWLVSYDRMINENGEKSTNTINWPKVLLVFFLYVFMFGSYVILVVAYFNDPTVSFENSHQRSFMAFKILSILFMIVILIYIIKYLVQFCKTYDSRLWRYKLIGLFNIFFIFCLALFIVTGSFEMYNLTGTEVLVAISILNLYVYYMQYLWSPSKEGLEEQQIQSSIEFSQIQIGNEQYDQLEQDNIDIHVDNEEIDEKHIEPVLNE